MLMLIRLTVLAFAIFTATANAAAQNSPLTPHQTEILRGATRVDGGLTKAQYDEFWEGFHCLSPGERERFSKSVQSEFPAILEYQRTLWLAAKQSIEHRKPIITPELRKEYARAEAYEKNHPTQGVRSTKMKQQAQELLEAAAFNTRFARDGRTFQITPAVVEQVLVGLDSSRARLQRLLAPSWQVAPTSKQTHQVDGR